MKYDYKAVEAKWQKVWEDEKTFHVEIDHKKPKFYALVEFPYPTTCSTRWAGTLLVCPPRTSP